MTASVRMETPVLYFYADREQVVSVKVRFAEPVLKEVLKGTRDEE